jgi:hypothetical protein
MTDPAVEVNPYSLSLIEIGELALHFAWAFPCFRGG